MFVFDFDLVLNYCVVEGEAPLNPSNVYRRYPLKTMLRIHQKIHEDQSTSPKSKGKVKVVVFYYVCYIILFYIIVLYIILLYYFVLCSYLNTMCEGLPPRFSIDDSLPTLR